MTLEELGALLRQERERQGVSLEKAATEIKISKKYLVALEEGVTKDLPHPVYAKGFVKNYARLLGLDPEALGAAFSAHYAVDEDHLRDAPKYEVRDTSSGVKERKTSLSGRVRPGGFSPPLWLALPLALAFAGVGWFFFFSSFAKDFNMESVTGFFKSKFEAPAPDAAKPAKPSSQQQGQPSASQSAAPAKPEAKPEQKPEGKPEQRPGAKSESAAAAETAGVSRELLAMTPGQGKPAQQPAPEQDITPEKLAAEAKFASQGNQTLEVNANQPAVLEVTAEDGQRRSFTLVKGQRITLRFSDKLSIRFQQAPAVAIKINGKDYPLEGGKADGRTIQFP